MLFGTTGVIRSGKTTNDTVLGVLEAEDTTSEVYSNFHIHHKRVKYLSSPDEFVQLEFEEMNGLCILQETQVWFESRGSTFNEVNKMVDKTVLQSGKLGFDILWDAQLSSSVDKRLRYMTLNWFATRRKIRNPLVLRYIYVNERNQIFKYHFTGKEFEKTVFPLFDTRERTDLIRKHQQQGRPEGIERFTEPITSPDGNKIDEATPQITDKLMDIDELIKLKEQGLVEIVQ